MRQRGSMKKSSEQITLNYSQALPESRGKDSFKGGGRFVTPAFLQQFFFVELVVHLVAFFKKIVQGEIFY
jgi:hypothetical protein